jgi:transcriptional regulator with XRE-family HTH domain
MTASVLRADSKIVVPQDGWLRAVRDSLGVTQREAAAVAGVTQQAFDQFEAGELKTTITLERLKKAAAALGCEVVYFLKPAGPDGETFVSLAERRSRQVHGAKERSRRPPVRHENEDLPVNLL